jgi:GNAT superfamily N-acetyltransferase
MYYVVAGHLGVLSSPVISPKLTRAGAAKLLLTETMAEICARGVQRIESPFLSIDAPWLVSVFEPLGFRTHGREFLRLALDRAPAVGPSPVTVHLEPWWGRQLDEAAGVMCAAYDGGVDAAIYLQYRTVEGCRVVLDNLLHQGTCGSLVAEATAIARHRGRAVGFVVVTEIAPRQGHLPQIVVAPEYQGRGIGRALMAYSVARLTERHFGALSLIVSRANAPALRLYQTRGFLSVLAFPVFTWET